MRKHVKDKMIVFSESVVALQMLAKELKHPFICGDTKPDERRDVIKYAALVVCARACMYA